MGVISRRAVLQAGVAGALGPGSFTFVLVPGAWHGAWAFSRVGALLERAGHRVDAVTLPGLAERKGELDAGVHLSTHVEDVVARVKKAATPVVLVGHSYAGVVVMPAAAAVPGQVALLVLLDAFIVEPGQSMLSLMKASYSESWRVRAREASKGLWVPPMLDAKAMGVSEPKDAKWVDGQLTPHPMATVEEPAAFDAKALEPVKKRYVWCARYPGFKRYAEKAKSLGWDVRQVDAGHDAMITAPDAVAQAIS
jgi:pimeloyl-ACP methyl ester carboxylesterase